MNFLHPMLFAAGLACVAVPILIHLLFRQRRRPVMWAAMRFLLEAYRKQRKKLKLEQWLLLAARCLLVGLFAAAVARPLLSAAGAFGGPSGRTVYVLLDNGLASTVRDGDGSGDMALARNKKEALRVLAELGAADRAGLVLLGAPAKSVVAPASPDVGAVRKLVEEAEATESATDLAGAFELLAAVISSSDVERSRPATVVVVSDFLSGSADLSRPLPGGLAELANVRVAASKPSERGAANVQVVGVEPLRPVVLTGGSAAETGAGQREQVRVSLRRSGPSVGEAGASTVRVRMVGAEEEERQVEGVGTDQRPIPPGGGSGSSSGAVSQVAVRWSPGQEEATASVQVDPPPEVGESRSETSESAAGVSSVIVAEIDRDGLAGDNVFRRPVGVREALRVGVIARPRFGGGFSADRLSPADWLRLALRPTIGAPMDIVDVEPTAVDAGTLASLDVAFAPEPDLLGDDEWSKLRRFVDGGGLLVVSPPPDASVHLWPDAMVRELGLSWRLSREVRTIDGGAGLALPESATTSGGSMLSLLSGEMESLVRPVRVFKTLGTEETGRQTEVVLSLADGTAWVVAEPPEVPEASQTSNGADEWVTPANGEARAALEGRSTGRGLVVYMTSAPALSWTDLPAKPLMVPLVQELARQGFGRAAGNWSSVAGRVAAAPARTAMLRSVGGESLAVAPSGVTAEAVRRAGVWRAVDEAGRFRGLVAVNADADAGRTAVQDPGAVRAWLAAAVAAPGTPGASGSAGTENGAEAGSGAGEERVSWLERDAPGAGLAARSAESPMSLPLLIGVLAVALVELVMARYFSHAFVGKA